MAEHSLYLLVLLALGVILFPGCVSQEQVQSSPAAGTPEPSPALTPVPTGTLPEMAASTAETTLAPPGPGADSTHELYAEPFVSINAIKRTTYSIGNCTMAQLVPAVAEPGYGLNSIRQSRLHFMSAGEFNQVIREYTENENAFSTCYGVPESPAWGFVNVLATVTARNSRPAMYNISMVVMFRGTEGPAYHTEMTLNPGQQYPFSIYIPIRVDQFQNIDSVAFSFRQLG